MRTIMAATTRIDRDKLLVALQDLDEGLIFELLDHALLWGPERPAPPWRPPSYWRTMRAIRPRPCGTCRS